MSWKTGEILVRKRPDEKVYTAFGRLLALEEYENFLVLLHKAPFVYVIPETSFVGDLTKKKKVSVKKLLAEYRSVLFRLHDKKLISKRVFEKGLMGLL